MSLASVSGYAKLHGVSKAAAQKWQARGLLKMVDGKVNVEASDQSLAHAGVGRYADAATRERRAATPTGNPVAAEVAGLAADLTAAAQDEDALAPSLIAFANRLAEGHYVNLIEAQTIKENGLALIRILDARKRANELIEMADAEAVLFEMFRLQRDAWLNFPSRVGPIIAADLGIEPERLVEVLTGHVHQHLADLGEPDNALREADQAAGDRAEGVDPATQA